MCCLMLAVRLATALLIHRDLLFMFVLALNVEIPLLSFAFVFTALPSLNLSSKGGGYYYGNPIRFVPYANKFQYRVCSLLPFTFTAQKM